jgi:hypothetical protein
VRHEIYDEVLTPFRDVFMELKNVDLPRVEMAEGRLSAFGAICTLACEVVSAVGAGAGAFAVVDTFAAASTGIPIAALPGATATNATLAFLGGGSLAGGGSVAAGTLVRNAVVACR